MDDIWITFLENKSSFRRQEYFNAMRAAGCALGDNGLKKRLEKAVKDGEIIHCGRDQYSLAKKQLSQYGHDYSELARKTAELIQKRHPSLEFSIFELTQLNEFVNLQIAHNAIFISVDSDTIDFAFDSLREEFQGKVLISPTPDLYHKYWADNMIVLTKLISEAPIGTPIEWQAPLEKIIVDLASDPLLKVAAGKNEYRSVLDGAIPKYRINQRRLLRYASRRAVDKTLLPLLQR